VKTEFYDQALVKLITDVARPNQSVIEFVEAVQRANPSGYSANTLSALIKEPPTFEVWSGVREKEYAGDVKQLLGAKTNATPFEFMLQISFTSSPEFAGAPTEEDTDVQDDSHPWEFPGISRHIHQSVISAVEKDAKAGQIVRDAAEFTQVQRFFRMALNGGLGEDFPMEKLVELNKVLHAVTPPSAVRTLRWNARPGIEASLQGSVTADNREEIRRIIQIRRDLGIYKDEQQVLRRRAVAKIE
jgi:hypothetical protein